jgi:hypothetical protein
MPIKIFQEIGEELLKTGESIETASRTIKTINMMLKDMAEVMNTLVTVIHETDVLLQNAGSNINKIKIPFIGNVFGPTGNALIGSGKSLHQSETQLKLLKNYIDDLSKSKGPLDDLTTDILDPLGTRLTELGTKLLK